MKSNSLLTGISVIAAMLTGFHAANAGTPLLDKSRPTHFVEVGMHIGEGASSMIENYGSQVPYIYDFSFNPGSQTVFGATAEIPFRNYFAIGTGIDFGINNYHWSMTILQPDAGTLNSLYSRSHYYNFTIPAYLSLRLNLGDKVRWHNELGCYLSFGAGGTVKTHAYSSSTNTLGQSQVTETSYSHKYYNDPDPIVCGVNETDWGLHLGTGVLVSNHWQVKCVFRVGARDLAENFGVLKIKMHTIDVNFRFGYVF